MNRVIKRNVWIAGLGLLALLPALAGAVIVGKNAGQVQGRWLEVGQPADLDAYATVAIGQVTVAIHWNKAGKEQPIDEQILVGKIQEELGINLRSSTMFRQVLTAPPPAGTAGVLRLDCDLQVEPGSRAMRYMVGFGAGKSKSVLEILLRDHATGRQIGRYHGYGTGSGMGLKMVGGGARKMTQDDIQENTKKFIELLALTMPAGRPAGGLAQASAPPPPVPAPPPLEPVAPQAAAPPPAAPGLVLHGVTVAPETVAPGSKLDLNIELTLTDPALRVGKVGASVSYVIQRGGETVFTMPAWDVAIELGGRSTKSFRIAAGSEPGLYTLLVTVSYGTLRETGAATFTIG